LKCNHLIHDHQINELKKLDENKNIKFIELEEVLKKSHTICIFHNHNMYKKINFEEYKNIRIILDPFKIFKKNLSINKSNIKYISL
jgi:UDP-N-acetyl-D-mannosaminuronate dehydrogenase